MLINESGGSNSTFSFFFFICGNQASLSTKQTLYLLIKMTFVAPHLVIHCLLFQSLPNIFYKPLCATQKQGFLKLSALLTFLLLFYIFSILYKTEQHISSTHNYKFCHLFTMKYVKKDFRGNLLIFIKLSGLCTIPISHVCTYALILNCVLPCLSLSLHHVFYLMKYSLKVVRTAETRNFNRIAFFAARIMLIK